MVTKDTLQRMTTRSGFLVAISIDRTFAWLHLMCMCACSFLSSDVLLLISVLLGTKLGLWTVRISDIPVTDDMLYCTPWLCRLHTTRL